jgi:serine kinase of HPr protein (carbohydrate metabolism regulator)
MSGIEGHQAGIHATAVVHGERGVLILGPSGSGKSALALALLARSRITGEFGALVGDDRIWLRSVGGRLFASGSPRTAGLIERRGVGLVAAPHEAATLVALVVEFGEPGLGLPRLPDEPDAVTIEGIAVPRLLLDSSLSAADRAATVEERLGAIAATDARRKGISLEHCAAVHKNGKLAGSRRARRTPEA